MDSIEHNGKTYLRMPLEEALVRVAELWKQHPDRPLAALFSEDLLANQTSVKTPAIPGSA